MGEGEDSRLRRLQIMAVFIVLLTIAFRGDQETHATNTTPIQHIVFIVKENHSFDHYFGRFPGANGATTGKVKVNKVVKTIPLGSFQNGGLPHYAHWWSAAHTAYDGGAMDRFDNGKCATPPYTCYQAATSSDTPNYWTYATNYLLNDNGFSDLEGAGFASVLKLAEGVFGLSPLTQRDATAGDLMKDLDLSQVHNPPTPLAQRSCPAAMEITPSTPVDYND